MRKKTSVHSYKCSNVKTETTQGDMTRRSFGELELSILRILQSGERMTGKEVHHRLDKNGNYNTIMTVMLRLTEKSLVARERVGAHYEYWILNPPKGKMSSILDHIKKKIFGINTTELICHLIENADDISAEDLNAVKMLVEKKTSKQKGTLPL